MSCTAVHVKLRFTEVEFYVAIKDTNYSMLTTTTKSLKFLSILLFLEYFTHIF